MAELIDRIEALERRMQTTPEMEARLNRLSAMLSAPPRDPPDVRHDATPDADMAPNAVPQADPDQFTRRQLINRIEVRIDALRTAREWSQGTHETATRVAQQTPAQLTSAQPTHTQGGRPSINTLVETVLAMRDGECGICMDRRCTRLFKCAHAMCTVCTLEIHTGRCPFCNAPLELAMTIDNPTPAPVVTPQVSPPQVEGPSRDDAGEYSFIPNLFGH